MSSAPTASGHRAVLAVLGELVVDMLPVPEAGAGSTRAELAAARGVR